MHPNAVAALAHLGYIGPQPGEWEVPQRKRKSWPSWAPPPPVRSPHLGLVTSDATSGVFVPQNASEWTTFNAANGWAIPDHLYLFQETGTNPAILDKIGSSNLATAGSPNAAQTIAGWSTKALQFTNGSTGQRTKSTAITDIATNSALVIFYASTPTTPASNLKFCSFGTTSNTASFTMLTTAAYRVDSAANNTTDSVTTENSAAVKCFALLVNRTSSFVKGYCTSMAAIKQPTFGSTMAGNEICWGSADNGTIATIALNVLYAAVWVGSNAEKTDQDIKSLMMQLGNNFWNPSWTVAYIASPAETDTLSESVSVAVTANIGLSESETESESLAAVLTAAPSLSESESESESLAAVAARVVGLSETDTLTEAIAVSVPYAYTLTESETESEVLAAVLTAAPAPAETDTLAESVGAVYAAAPSVSETATTAEQLASVYAATAALSDAGVTAEALLAALAAVAGISETDTLAEAVAQGLILHSSVSESAAVAEATAAIYHAAPSLADSPSFTDFVNIAAVLLNGLAETTTIAEAVLALKFRKGDMSSSAAAENQIISSVAEATATLFCAIVAKAYGGRIDKL